ncbi:MAG: hypothetical protein IT169_12570 [Bryobacterales bacterium]|nr:hypothetical protein [Bryobacterales bacterium]
MPNLAQTLRDFRIARKLTQKLATAEIGNEPLTDEERRGLNEAIEWSKHNKPIPMEDVLGDLGLTIADWETLAKTPLNEPLPLKHNG